MSEPKPVLYGGYDWHGAFLAYCHGHTTGEIAEMYSIPHEKLLRKMSVDRWEIGRQDLAKLSPIPFEQQSPQLASLEKLQHNRQRIVNIVGQLFEDAAEVTRALREKRLKFKKHFVSRTKEAGTTIIEKEVDPSMQDRVALSNYLKTLSEIAYRALGDVAPGESQVGPSLASQVPNAAITIILPEAIAKPRAEREEPKAAGPASDQKVIDIEIKPNEPTSGTP